MQTEEVTVVDGNRLRSELFAIMSHNSVVRTNLYTDIKKRLFIESNAQIFEKYGYRVSQYSAFDHLEDAFAYTLEREVDEIKGASRMAGE